MVFDTLREFGVSVYALENGPKNGNYAPSFHIIDHVIYHTSLDTPDLVPASGLERSTRAFAAGARPGQRDDDDGVARGELPAGHRAGHPDGHGVAGPVSGPGRPLLTSRRAASMLGDSPRAGRVVAVARERAGDEPPASNQKRGAMSTTMRIRCVAAGSAGTPARRSGSSVGTIARLRSKTKPSSSRSCWRRFRCRRSTPRESGPPISGSSPPDGLFARSTLVLTPALACADLLPGEEPAG